MESANAFGQALLAPLFVTIMVAVLLAGLAASQLLDSSLWVRKRSGLGWTVDFSNPHAKLLGVFTAVWVVFLVIGLINPDAPGVDAVMHLLAGLLPGT